MHSDDDLVTIAYFSNSAEAGLACEFLLNHGLDAVLAGGNFGGLEPLPGAGGFSEIRLVVPKHDADAASQLYQAFFENPAAALAEDQEVPRD